MRFSPRLIRCSGDSGTDSRSQRMHVSCQRVHIPYRDPDFPIGLNAQSGHTEIALFSNSSHGQRGDERVAGRDIVKLLLADSCVPRTTEVNSQPGICQFEL